MGVCVWVCVAFWALLFCVNSVQVCRETLCRRLSNISALPSHRCLSFSPILFRPCHLLYMGFSHSDSSASQSLSTVWMQYCVKCWNMFLLRAFCACDGSVSLWWNDNDLLHRNVLLARAVDHPKLNFLSSFSYSHVFPFICETQKEMFGGKTWLLFFIHCIRMVKFTGSLLK